MAGRRGTWLQLVVCVLLVASPAVAQERGWPMAGGNPARTSWVPDEVRGRLYPEWYRPFDPYISQAVQLVTADGLVLVATAIGLVALDAETGAERWRYRTALPLGHSPTVAEGVAYVAGLDRQIHALSLADGEPRWRFAADGGFDTSPLVVEERVIAGCHDGRLYAVDAASGAFLWAFDVGAPIRYSAAHADGVVYFAAQDGRAYAVDAASGSQQWRSARLPGGGFTSYWPVVREDRVIFTASSNYRGANGGSNIQGLERDEVFPSAAAGTRGTLIGAIGREPGPWAPGTPTIDGQRIIDYLTDKPWRRTVFVLDRDTGEEREVAPVAFAGEANATRFPPVLGIDGVLYQQNRYLSDPYIPGGHIAGWVPGSRFLTMVSSDWGAVDEPHAAAATGDTVQWNLCCDRQAGAFDITIPNDSFYERALMGTLPPTGGADPVEREWSYFGYNLAELLPDYSSFDPSDLTRPMAAFGGPNGIYGFHGDTNPPVPYDGRVYGHFGNAVVAFGPSRGGPSSLARLTADDTATEPVPRRGSAELAADLAEEVQRIIDAGHLRPGYRAHSLFDHRATATCGEDLIDYFALPAETLYFLTLALPHLPDELRTATEAYLQSEYAAYPPLAINHIGYRDGAAREAFETPAEAQAVLDTIAPAARAPQQWEGWRLNPFSFYALFKYAEHFGNAAEALADADGNLESPPSETILDEYPFVHNAFIAGYVGYLGLERLAGRPETASVRATLDGMLAARAATFDADTPYGGDRDPKDYCRTVTVARNFMYLVPELATYLREHARDAVEGALDEYARVAPLWFVSFAQQGYAENAVTLLQDAHGPFVARALVSEAPPSILDPLIDAPGFARGDLYYLHRLVLTLDAYVRTPTEDVPPSDVPTTRPAPGDSPGASDGGVAMAMHGEGCSCRAGAMHDAASSRHPAGGWLLGSLLLGSLLLRPRLRVLRRRGRNRGARVRTSAAETAARRPQRPRGHGHASTLS